MSKWVAACDGRDRGPPLLVSTARSTTPGIVRALFANVRAGHVVQGGSTITQQLARNLYIKKPSQTFGRKATEACLAIKLAREKSKRWILNAYINQVFYGNRAYGIEAAAQTYFSKRAQHLTLPAGCAARGSAAGSRPVFDPFHRPQQAIAAPRRGAAGDARERLHHGDAVRRRGRATGGCTSKPGGLYTTHPRAVLLQLRARRAAEAVRLEHRAHRRAARLHDDRPAAATVRA